MSHGNHVSLRPIQIPVGLWHTTILTHSVMPKNLPGPGLGENEPAASYYEPVEFEK